MPKFLEVSDAAAARAALEATTVGSDVFTAEDADEARTALGATTVGSDVFTATDAADARTTLGATTVGSNVFTATDAAAARTAIGAGTSSLTIGTTSTTAKAGNYQPSSTNISDSTATGRALITAADAAAARTTLGATTVGSNLFTTASAAAARTTLGATTVGSNVFTATDAVAARSDLGAEATSVDTFNVQNYGAVGDNSTDDTTAIQSAIDAAEARVVAGSNARVVVYFPAGRYLVNGGLTVERNDVHFVGAGINATRIQRSQTNETPVISSLAQNFTIRDITIRNDNSSYGSDTNGSRSVAIYMAHPDGDEWDNSVDVSVKSCFISGFYAGISIFGQGLTVLDSAFTRLVHGVILDFPDTADLVDKGDDNQNYAETGFRKFRFEGIHTQVTNGGFIKNTGTNAEYLRSCIISNFSADLGVQIWEGVMSNTIVTNWQVEMSAETSNPTVFVLADGSHDSIIANGRVVGRQADGSISERAPENLLICGDVTSLHIRNLHLENLQEHGLDFTGFVHGLYLSDCHFKSVGYSGANYRQILFRDNDTQAFLDNVTFDIDAATTTTPIIALADGSSDTFIVGDNLRVTDENHTGTDVIATPSTGTVIENGTSFAAPTVGDWKLGQVIWNKAASAVPLGWRCTARGVPGTWESIYKAPDTVWIPAASGYADTGATPVTPTKLASGEVPAIFMPGAGDTYLRAPVSIPEDWDTMWIDVFYTHEEASPSGSVRFNVGVVHLDLNAQIGSAITSQRSDTVDMAGVVANDFTIHTAGAAVDVDTTGGPVMVRAGRIGGSVSDTFTGDIAVIGVQLRKAT